MSKRKNVILLTLGRGFNSILTLLLLPYMARSLDYTEYATYGQVLLILEILMVLINVAGNQYLYVLFANKSFKKEDIVVNAFFINIFLSLLGVSLIFLLSDYIGIQFKNALIKDNLLIYAFAAPFLLIQSTVNFVLYYYNKYKTSILIEIINNTMRISAIIAGVQIFHSLKMVFILLLAVNIFISLIYLIKLPVKITGGKISTLLIKDFFKYGYPLGITAIIGILLKRTDGVMISSMLPPEDYAIYRMGAIEIPFLMIIFSSVMTVTLPEVTKLFHQGKINEIVALKRKAITHSALIMYPILIFILVFSEPLLTLYLGEKYKASIPVFVIYNLILFFRVNDYRDILVAASQTKLILFFDVLVFTLNLIINLFFILKLGIYGAVIASLISFILLANLLLFTTLNKIKTSFLALFDLKKLFIITFFSMSFSFSFYIIHKFIPKFYFIPIFFSCYILILYVVYIKTNIIDINTLKSLIKIK